MAYRNNKIIIEIITALTNEFAEEIRVDDVVAFAAFHAAADIFVRSDGGIVSGQTITVHRQ